MSPHQALQPASMPRGRRTADRLDSRSDHRQHACLHVHPAKCTWMKARLTCGCSAAATLLVAPQARPPRWLACWLLGTPRFCITKVEDLDGMA